MIFLLPFSPHHIFFLGRKFLGRTLNLGHRRGALLFRGAWREVEGPASWEGRSPGGGDGEAIRRTPTWGECTRQAPGHLSCSDLGRAQNAGPTESAPLWSIREPEPEQLRPGKCMQLRAHFRQLPCRATWSLSSVDQESTQANPVWPRHCEHSRQVWSVPPSPQHDSEPK